MARNYMQKIRTKTIVNGFTVRDAQPVAVSYEIDKNVGINTAQQMVRKQDPSFSAISVTPKRTMYKMTFEDFFRLATPEELPEGADVDPDDDVDPAE